MTKAQDAYEEAQRRIAADPDATELGLSIKNLEAIPLEIATLSKLDWLDLSHTSITSAEPLSTLTKLETLSLNRTQVTSAEPLSTLTNLKRLSLTNTPITSVEPLTAHTDMSLLYLNGTQIETVETLANLTNLVGLDLEDTSISDLRPLKNLNNLTSQEAYAGLTYKNCAATKLDPELKRLSEIEDNQERTRETLAYLKTLTEWPPSRSRPIPKEPDQDRILSVQITPDEKLDVDAATPTPEELDDRIKRACHTQLKEAVESFIAASGNQHHRLTQRSRSFYEKLDKPFNDLDMLDLHFGIEMLADVLAKRDERKGEDILSAEMVVSLGEIARIGPGLVRDNADVEDFENRRTRDDDLQAPIDQDVKDALLAKISTSDDIIGELLRSYADQAKGQAPSTRRGLAGTIINRNTIIAATAAVVSGIAINRADALVLWLFQNS
ncbi:MAG: leucine-rich repeat domain-containing protein [Sulfitobacter sp.]